MLAPSRMAQLSIQSVVAPDATPARFLLFLHGILGSGANWRTFARQVVAARPEWGALLVDLRLHGESVGFPPPHTVEAAAHDIVEALPAVLPAGATAAGVVGHSFGGKVGIVLAGELAEAASPLRHLVVV